MLFELDIVMAEVEVFRIHITFSAVFSTVIMADLIFKIILYNVKNAGNQIPNFAIKFIDLLHCLKGDGVCVCTLQVERKEIS